MVRIEDLEARALPEKERQGQALADVVRDVLAQTTILRLQSQVHPVEAHSVICDRIMRSGRAAWLRDDVTDQSRPYRIGVAPGGETILVSQAGPVSEDLHVAAIEIYGKHNLVRMPTAPWIPEPELEDQTISLTVLTPIRYSRAEESKTRGSRLWQRPPEGPLLLRTLHTRLTMVAAALGMNEPIERPSPAGLKRIPGHIVFSDYMPYVRKSQRTGSMISYSGWVGRDIYQVSASMQREVQALLAFGEVWGVGKGTTVGAGSFYTDNANAGEA